MALVAHLIVPTLNQAPAERDAFNIGDELSSAYPHRHRPGALVSSQISPPQGPVKPGLFPLHLPYAGCFSRL